jgi:hypothetical protein
MENRLRLWELESALLRRPHSYLAVANPSEALLVGDRFTRSRSRSLSITKIAQVNVLRYSLKARVRFDIALQKNCYLLLATTIFNVVAVP